jgi:hypothetical protein
MPVFLQDVDVLVITDLMEEKTNFFFFRSSLEFSRTSRETFSSAFNKAAKSDFVTSSVRRRRKTLPPAGRIFVIFFFKFLLKHVLNV